MDRLDFKRREVRDKESVQGVAHSWSGIRRRRTKQQSIKTKLEDPYGGFLQSN